MMKENELLEKKELREKVIGRTEILDKVGDLLLLPNTEYATKVQVANYYDVKVDAIESIERRNKEELISDGYRKFKNKEIKFLIGQNNIKGKISNAGMNLFPIRAILHIAFYLSESEVARQVRKELLKENPKLYYKFSKDNQLRLKKYEIEIKNYLEFSFGKENVEYQVQYGKYFLDFVLFNKIHIEVDEYGHTDYDKKYEKERENYILSHTDYWTIRYNPQIQKPYELITEMFGLFEHIGYPNELLTLHRKADK